MEEGEEEEGLGVLVEVVAEKDEDHLERRDWVGLGVESIVVLSLGVFGEGLGFFSVETKKSSARSESKSRGEKDSSMGSWC